MSRNGYLNCIIKLTGNFILALLMLQAEILEGTDVSAIKWRTYPFLNNRSIFVNKPVKDS